MGRKAKDDTEMLTNINCATITYAAIRKAMNNEPFDMKLSRSDYAHFAAAVNQGIDSRLQACYCPERGDKVEGNKVWLSLESTPVLIRRLLESDDENAQMLGSDMLTTLGFDENGKWAKRED
jgi:hypothetical protein